MDRTHPNDNKSEDINLDPTTPIIEKTEQNQDSTSNLEK